MSGFGGNASIAEAEIVHAKKYCTSLGIDFRTKEFLGEYDGRCMAPFATKGHVTKNSKNKSYARRRNLSSEAMATCYRCHSDLYEGRTPIGNIPDEDFEIEEKFP